MDIFLDANTIIADLRLSSQRIRLLTDFARKTQSRLILHQIVVAEVEAKIKKYILEQTTAIEKSIQDARNKGITRLPEYNSELSQRESMREWKFVFNSTFGSDITTIMKLDNSSLEEALRRSIERVKPCSDRGEEIRDALIWLNIVEYAKKQKSYKEIVFISENTKEFADSDKKTLHPILVNDIIGLKTSFVYFSSLDSFVKLHAQPVAHVNREWIISKINMANVSTIIRDYLRWRGSSTFRRSIRGYSGRYQIVGNADITSLDITFEDFTLWQLSDKDIELKLNFRVDAEADVELKRMNGQLSFFELDDEAEALDEEEVRTLSAVAELNCAISARIEDEGLLLVDVEDVYRL